jgi:hypothetical protein
MKIINVYKFKFDLANVHDAPFGEHVAEAIRRCRDDYIKVGRWNTGLKQRDDPLVDAKPCPLVDAKPWVLLVLIGKVFDEGKAEGYYNEARDLLVSGRFFLYILLFYLQNIYCRLCLFCTKLYS